MNAEVQLSLCREMLRDEGLVVPRVKLKHTREYLSFTDGRSIYLGRMVSFLAKRGHEDRLQHTLLHELFHVLVLRVPPVWEVRNAFGGRDAWNQEQRLHRIATCSRDFVSRYARTHPEEDLVETAVFVLEGGTVRPGVKEKVRAVEEWFEAIRKRKRSYH